MEELSDKELVAWEKQREKEYAAIGQALAEKYLGGLDLRQLKVELDKYKGEEKGKPSRVALYLFS